MLQRTKVLVNEEQPQGLEGRAPGAKTRSALERGKDVSSPETGERRKWVDDPDIF